MKNIHVRLLFVIILLVAGAIWAVVAKPIHEGLDIQGGMRVVLRAMTNDPNFVKKKGVWNQEKLQTVADIMRRRVDSLGVAEPVVYPQGEDRVVVELPGLKHEEEALQIIQTTASLEFRYVTQLADNTWSTEPDTVDGRETGYERIIDRSTGKPVPPEQLNDLIFSQPPILSGDELLSNSKVELGQGGYVIDFEFRDDAKRIFEDFTRTHIGKPLAIFLDKKLISAPNIEDVIPGKGIIRGRFTAEQARTLSSQLNAGALPVPLERIELTRVEATLGRTAVHQTTVAGIIGLVAVLVVMAAWYLLPGILADICLVLYTLFVFAIFKGAFEWLGIPAVTLTVPGIAGFILSIGMAVDANILIFERLKEERKTGKSLRASIETGFKRAFSAIFDSNVCTLITCLILGLLGTGQVRGFAITLAIGVIVSMFTAITCTRTFLLLIASTPFGQNDALYGLNRGFHPRLNVTRNMYKWFALSLAVIVPGLIFWGMGGIKRSIEFTGGTEITAQFGSSPSASQITSALTGAGIKESRVLLAQGNRAFITTPHLRIEQSDRVKSAIQQLGGTVQGESEVSGTISDELKLNAIKSVFYASLLIILYLAFRFSIPNFIEGLRFGTCAVIALLHDVLVVWGLFAIMGYLANWQIDSLFVTAMLTVIGFSVHDTIIIFDRIRENLHYKARGETFADVADRSIEQTFARSVGTSSTVIITLLALLIWGGPVIKLFVAALVIGVISGTYSSIFNATPLLVLWKRLAGDRSMVAAGAGGGSGVVGRASAPRPIAKRAEPVARPKATPAAPAVAPRAGDGQGATAATAAPPDAVGAAAGADRLKPKKKKRRM